MAEILNAKVINNNILALNDYIIKGRPKTFLNANIASGVSSFTVFNIAGFTEGDYYVLIGKIGSGNAEILKMHASTAPTGNTITPASNTAKAHDANEPVYFIGFNQIEYSNEAVGVDAGTSAALATEDIDASKLWSIYDDTTDITGMAYIRFKNEAGSSFSGYSAPAPYASAVFNTVEYMIRQAMIEAKQTDTNGEPKFTEELTTQMLLNQTNECLRDIRKQKNKISWTQAFQTILGQTARGVFAYPLSALLSEIYDIYSFRAINALRLGGERDSIKVDPNYFFNVLMNKVHFTQVRTTGAVGAITLEIDNSYDFDDSGSIQVGSQTITYTSVTRSATAGVLIGVPASGTGAIATEIAVDDYVFQGHTEGQSIYWTMYNGTIYIYNLPDSSFDNFNVNIDYFKVATAVDSLDDAIDYIQFDLVKNWLKWKIRAITKNDGVESLDDPSYSQYREGLSILVRKDRDLNKKIFRNTYESRELPDVNPRRLRDGDARRL